MTKKTDNSTFDTKAFREAARILGYGVWKHNFRMENPEATDQDRAKAWEEAKEVQSKAGKKALLALQAKGFSISKL